MAENLLIRNIPQELLQWIDKQRQTCQLTRDEFILSMMTQSRSRLNDRSLFETDVTEKPPFCSLPFTFVDLFAGIGGFRIGLEKVGGRCLFSCEWDKYCQKTYKAWFGETPHDDIRTIEIASIPDHDVLAAGFPCQPFSIAGVSKKKSLGRAHGFQDQTQGTLFYNLATIVQLKRPPVLFLENVKNLLSHDGGKTFEVIRATLDSLEYAVFYKVIDAAPWVPQHRERIYLVCFDRHVFGNQVEFRFPTPPKDHPKFSSILEPAPDQKYTLTDHLWDYLQKYARKHKAKGHGFGFSLTNPEGVARTLSARYYKDGSEILIPQGAGQNPRRLTPREAARLQGFDDAFEIVVSDTQAYKQFGNAVVPLVTQAIAKEIVSTLTPHIST